MDTKLYNALREQVIRRLDLEKARGEDMLEFAKAFAKHVNSVAGTSWVACHLGVMKGGQFVIELPKIEDRTVLPFTLRVNFSNQPEDMRPPFGVSVDFVLSWSGESDIKLQCMQTAKQINFTVSERHSAEVLSKASDLLDEPLEAAITQFVR